MIQIKGIKGGRDRSGLCSLTYSYLAQDMTPEAALTASLPNAPSGLPEVARVLGEWDVDNNSFIINATFEGVLAEYGEDDGEFELSAEFSEEPIEAHPFIDRIMQLYQGTRGDDGRVQFPEKLANKGSSGTGLGSGRSKSEVNPLFGTTSYPAMRIVASHRRTMKSLPASLWKSVGTVVSSLPSGFDEPGGKKWLVMPPQARRRGRDWDVTRRWKDVELDRNAAVLAALIQR